MKKRKAQGETLAIFTIAALLFAGCGPKDGLDELNDGWVAFEAHDLKKADRLFSKSVECNPSNVDALVASAQVKLALGDLAAAKDALAKASARAGSDEDVILLGAQLAYHSKDYPAATAAFEKIAKNASLEASTRADALVGMAIVEMTCDRNDRARIALLKALILDRHSAPMRYHLGLLYRNLGYNEASLEQFEAFVMLNATADPRVQRVQRQVIPALKDAIARNAMARPGADKRNSTLAAKALQNAEGEWKKGNFKKARAWYADALKSDPLSHPAALGLARAWIKTDSTPNGLRSALACYQTASSLKPGATQTLLATAKLAVQLGNTAVAVEAYSRALAADPKNTEALDGYIRQLRKTGSSGEKAARLWQGYRDMLKPAHKHT